MSNQTEINDTLLREAERLERQADACSVTAIERDRDGYWLSAMSFRKDAASKRVRAAQLRGQAELMGMFTPCV